MLAPSINPKNLHVMNKFVSSAFAAAMVFAATTTFAQGTTAAQMGKGYGITNNSGGGTTAPNGAASRTTLAGLPQHSLTSHEYIKPVPNTTNRSSSRGYSQGRYMVTAVVLPMSLVFRTEGERALRTSAPTKSAAMSRMRQMIAAIGVPVRVVSLEITSL